MSPPKTLWPYQVRVVTDVSRTAEDVLVEQPTGSGKTVEIVTLVAVHLGRRFTHALIAAPQEHIEQAFVKRDYELIAFPDCRGVAIPPIQVPRSLIKGARNSQLGPVKRVIHYLRQAAPLDHAFACTHATLNRITANDLPEDLSGKALFIDEAHHASADCLGQIVTLWRERGGQLLFFTATPYRSDGRPVRLERMRVFRRSLAEHMADRDENGKPYAPGILESEIVALGKPGDTVTGGVFHGEEPLPSKDVNSAVEAIRRKWLDDGKPKAIVRVPPMRGGSQDLVGQLIRTLSDSGARVLNATGTAGRDKQRFLAGLAVERNRTFAESKYDVMIGIQRVFEGTDWPLCSAVYCVGMPGSLNTVVQLLGRAMRPKDESYPSLHRDRARLVFFVPCAGGSALADLGLDHSRHALLTCCFLADHEVGQEWIVLREVRRGIEDILGSPDQNSAAADAENEANAALDPEVRAEVALVLASAREQIIAQGGEPTLREVIRLGAESRPDLPEGAMRRVAAEILASQAGPTGEAVRTAIHQGVTERLRIDPQVKTAMEETFAVLLQQFRHATLKDCPVLEAVGRQVHSVTGGHALDFAEKLREAAKQLASRDFNIQKTEDFCRRYRSLDNLPSQHIDDPQERSDAAWLSQKRQAKQGRSRQGFFPEMEQTAARHGMAGLFDVRDPKAEALRKTRELCGLIAGNANIPTELVNWRNRIKGLKQRHLRGEGVVGYYSEMETVASECGLQGVFDVQTDEQQRREALSRVEALCERLSRRGDWPSANGSNKQERADATLVSAIRMAKQGRGKHLYLPEMEAVAERYGLLGLFDEQRTRMLSQTREFCRKYRHTRLPTAMPSDPNRKDGQWLAAKKRVKAGEASGTWYPEMDEIAREEGLNGLFDTELITRERALDWLRRFYQRHGNYPNTAQGRVEEAVEDGYGYREISWQALHRRFPLQQLIDASRPPFAPGLVVKWNEEELSAGRSGIAKTGTGIVELASAHGYPMSGTAINALLRRDHGMSLAKLLRPLTRTEFTVAMAERWLKQEFHNTGSWPTVTTKRIGSAAVDGYAGLSGNALNKLLRKAGTSLRQVKTALNQEDQAAPR